MGLIADRFLEHDAGRVVDLATGDSVSLRLFTAGGVSDEARWLRRCARLAALRHPSLAVLLDYGATGEGRRFEVWRSEGAWRGAASAAAAVTEAAATFLTALRLAPGSEPAVHLSHGLPVCVPADDAGYDLASPPDLASQAGARDHGLAPGLELIPRGFVSSFSERLLSIDARSPRVFSLWAPAGAGLRTALLEVARLLRHQGIVPLGLDALPQRSAIDAGRTLALIATGDPAAAWRVFLDLSLASRRPHLLIVGGECELAQAQRFTLERFSVAQLLAAVRPSPLPAATRALLRLAHGADGWPGRFASRLFTRQGTPAAPDRAPLVGRAAEESTPYVVQEDADTVVTSTRPWPISADVLRLRQRQDTAVAQLQAGLHVRGERLLRQANGALSRRADWAHAAEGALALARALLGRGRWRDVGVVLEEARRAAARAGQAPLQLAIATVAGRAALDAVHLDEAETVLESALAAARSMAAHDAEIGLALELSRCLFWRGRYEAAAALLQRREAGGAWAAPLAIAQSRLALGRGDAAGALSCAAAAMAMTAGAANGRQRAAAAAAAALVHLAVADHEAVRRDAEAGLVAARRAHAPLAGLRLRLLLAEQWRRTGRSAAAARMLQRLRRRGTRQIPPILRARLELGEALLQDDGPDTALRLASASGLAALTLFAPAAKGAGPRTSMRQLVEILRCCQSADDEVQILTALVQRLRDALQASAVVVFAEERGQLIAVVSEGGRIERDAAERVRAFGDVIGPRPGPGPAEGGVAVRYGDRAVGAIVVRWPAPDRCDLRACIELLTTAAVAAGPALAAEQARRQPKVAVTELVGRSDVMERIRLAVERAAPAPFAVLIEGESGTGKEMVARAIHRRSARRDRTCCTVNCAALPDDLVESELFGHARGAFTGAMVERPGVFDEANGGTLFLDEIGELSLRAQAKILRALQEGEVRRVGENAPRRVDVRVIAATNRDLRQEVANGRFRLDLLYRLDVIRIPLPPLRERLDDLPLLVEHFWRDATARLGSRATLSVAAVAALARYHWPGNVRELQNVLAALAVRCPRRGIVPPAALPPLFEGREGSPSCRLDAARRTFEAAFVRAALARAGGHRLRAAEELGVTRQGLAKLMTRLGLAEPARLAAARE